MGPDNVAETCPTLVSSFRYMSTAALECAGGDDS